ncbi:Clp protease ClpP [Bacteroides fragilis]|nr:Clp protease ClpP [Bacteroides fragilis]
MSINDFKNIVGEARTGETAIIRFFGKVTEQSTNQFNEEFEYLENVVRPSLIRILINSEGGSVLHGMTSYATIQNSLIDTECIIEGMAASMGSVLWAAGNRSLMRDYSILMIHNPFLPSAEDSEASELVKAFTRQLETIYRKRFGLSPEKVKAIMSGNDGNDGTYFDAEATVKAGIIPEKNILRTSQQLRDKVKQSIAGIQNATEIQDLMSKISAEIQPDIENKHIDSTESTLIQEDKHNHSNNMNDENTISFELGAVAASLGIKDKYEIKDVMSRISSLMHVEAQLTETNRKLTDIQTVIAGKDATILNLQKDLADTTAKLTLFEKKEEDERKSRIETLVENAITEGKIDKETKAQWVEMALSNFDLAEKTLVSIPAREKITQQIATDPDNVQAAAEAVKTVEEKMAEKVKAIVGEEFKFKKMD